MGANTEVVRTLNGLLTTELRAINQYFLDAKLAGHWGFEHLAERFREASFQEMRDAETIMDRILLLGGLPNLQRVEPFAVGETVREQFDAAVELESKAIDQLRDAIRAVETQGDAGTSTLLRSLLVDEEGHLDWLQAQVGLMEQLGDAHYLAQQVRGG
jgi:bacterioferritin